MRGGSDVYLDLDIFHGRRRQFLLPFLFDFEQSISIYFRSIGKQWPKAKCFCHGQGFVAEQCLSVSVYLSVSTEM